MTDSTVPRLDATARHARAAGPTAAAAPASERPATGRQGETASLAYALLARGVEGLGPDLERIEPLLFGIGGGIGMAMVSFDLYGVYLGTRYHTKETDRPEFLGAICERLGIRLDVAHGSSDAAAEKRLRGALGTEPNAAPIVWVDAGRLPYRGAPGVANAYHTIAVAGESDDSFVVSDMAPSMVRISAADLRAARATTYAPRRRMAIVAAGERSPVVSSETLVAAVQEGITRTVARLAGDLGASGFGLTAFDKLRSRITGKGKGSWLAGFPDGRALVGGAASIFGQIEARGPDGAAFRPLYADFLDAAAAVIGDDRLTSASSAAREAAAAWRSWADALLPDAVEGMGQLRRVLRKQRDLYTELGGDAAEQLVALRAEAAKLEEVAGRAVVSCREDYIAHLADSLPRVHDAERRLAALLAEVAAPNGVRVVHGRSNAGNIK